MNACMLCPSHGAEESELREPVPRQAIFMLNRAIFSGQSPRTGQKALPSGQRCRPPLPQRPDAATALIAMPGTRSILPRYDGIQSPADQGA